ncbi:MAG: transcriptional regulator, GntR family [Solirubrobacterales bacterium]|nr:transcriptional regulator, GntR family [Solirubrobacterales bacterium]
MNDSQDQALRIVSIADRVYEQLRDRITHGELEAGSRLHQANISSELGVSRTPVREALARLAADGLVELLPNRGARVADVSLADMRTSYEARLGVEPLAARFAAERREPEDLERIRASLAHQHGARSARGIYEAMREFHLALVDAAHNPQLSRFARGLWAGRISLHVVIKQAGDEDLAVDADEHEEILAAIERSDGPEAERLMNQHIADSLERLLEHSLQQPMVRGREPSDAPGSASASASSASEKWAR